MKKIIVFFVAVYLSSLAGGWWYISGIMRTTENAKIATSAQLNTKDTEIVELKKENATLKNRITEARAYVSFLSLALCPTLEAGDKNSLCTSNGTEWFSQTITAGTVITDPEIKDKIISLVQTLNTKNRPNAKQFYELLRPLEVRALKDLVENFR